MDEEVQKRNTDCVYFLASPLTCKKGNNCEFRHSEEARMNPRDCWYWLYKVCLNPNCSFRHPPLEAKLTSASPALQSPTPSATPSVASVFGASAVPSNKTSTPCYFFSQGYCSKAEKCPFLHGPPLQSTVTPGLQQKTSSKTLYGTEVLLSNKMVSASKGNGSTPQQLEKRPEKTPLSGSEPKFVPPKTLIPVEEAPRIPTDSKRGQAIENSVISAPSSRDEKGWIKANKLIKSQFSEDVSNTIQREVNGSKKGLSMARSRQKPLPEIEKAQPIHSGGNSRNHNVSRAAETRRRSSPMQLEKNDLDQREDGEYSPLPDSRGRMKARDESVAFVRAPQARSDNLSAQRHQKPHQLQRIEHGYDPNDASLEHTRHHKLILSNARTVEMPKRSLEEYSDAGDLRAHLSKRRRNATGEHVEAKNSSRRENYMELRKSQQDLQEKETIRQPSRNVGIKRPHHNAGTSPDSGFVARISPGRTSLRNSPNRHFVADRARKEPKIKDKDLTISTEVAPLSDARAHLLSKTKKPQINQEMSEFSGPKSLAQIKAERMAKHETITKDREENGLRIKSVATHVKYADAKPFVSAKTVGSMASTSKVEKMQIESTLTYQKGSIAERKPIEFEGPKPLSLLLKGKRKVESNDSTKETHEEQSKGVAEISREIEDGEVREEEDKLKHLEPHSVHDTNITSLPEELMSRSSSEDNNEGTYQSDQEAQDDIDSLDDRLKLDLESGENASGDDDYVLDDDDDEDDFAKKLGGFFS